MLCYISIMNPEGCDAARLMAFSESPCCAGESLRISVVKSGRTPISVVLNEASKRKSSAQVAFVDGARLLGDEAAALGVKYPDRVYARQVPLDLISFIL